MNAQQIITLARLLSKRTSTWLITDDEMVSILNKSYKDFYKKIISLDRNYFWDRWTWHTVANQYEYSIAQPTLVDFGMFKPEKIRIKYTSTSDYIDVEFKDWDSLEYTPEEYALNQPTDEPFAIITDTNYVHIFPTPTVSITWWLIYEWAKKPYDLTISSVSSDILIDELYHEAIAYMMCVEMEKVKWDYDAKGLAQQDADRESVNALKSMWLLTTKVVRAKIKDLSDLE